jgi:hypothetical protein
VALAVDREEDFVQVPFITRAGTPTAEFVRVGLPELVLRLKIVDNSPNPLWPTFQPVSGCLSAQNCGPLALSACQVTFRPRTKPARLRPARIS